MSVYFIYEDPFENGLRVDPDIKHIVKQNLVDYATEFKVGESNKPTERVKNLQTGNPRQLIIYRTIECATKERAKAMEDMIHIRYAHRRNRGEWFTLSKEEVDEICKEIIRLNALEWEKAKE